MARYRYNYDDDYGAFPRYVSVAEKQARNRQAATKLCKKNSDIQPVVVEGGSIAKSWWGKSWNANLERYADYSNRIGRGRSYVRHGAVLDLRIEPGKVQALVQGSRSTPYNVTVTIEKLSPAVWNSLREAALAKLDSLTDLLAGTFPKGLKDTFFAQGTGLFPSPKEISFDCSCPDWASMCKHVAAVLYGIGNRLDTSPELLFTLREVTVDELIARTVEATTESLINKADQAKGDDVLADADLGSMFGIELDDIEPDAVELPVPAPIPAPGKPATKATRHTTKKTAVGKSRTAPRTKPGKPADSAGKTLSKRGRSKAKTGKPEPGRMLEQFVEALGRSRARFTTADLIDKLPAWTRLQVTNTLQRAVSEGRVERVERGIYRRI